MQSIDTTLKILWISDIHFSENYKIGQTSKVFEDYLSSFISYCKELTGIDYILISGDIAQSGFVSEYQNFIERVLDPLILLDNLKEAKILINSGNHDLQRDGVSIFQDYINEVKSRKFDRNQFLTTRKKFFKQAFSNYSNAFAKYRDRLPATISKTYKEDFLHGYFLDHEKKVIFVLLNSSWFSFGDSFLTKYFETYLFCKNDIILKNNEKDFLLFVKDFANNNEVPFFYDFMKVLFSFNNYKEIPDNIKFKFINELKIFSEQHSLDNLDATFDSFFENYESLYLSSKSKEVFLEEVKNIAEDYGKQAININVFDEFSDLICDIESFNDYIIIQSCHHHWNWLSWEERVNYDGKDEGIFLLNKHVDLLLNGHEHVPHQKEPDYLSNQKLLHIPAGCFMEYHKKPNEFDIKNNWFSILSINTKKRTVTQDKIIYSKNSKTTYEWTSNTTERFGLNKKYKTSLNKSRRGFLISKINSNSSNVDFLIFLMNIFSVKSDNLNPLLATNNFLFFNEEIAIVFVDKHTSVFDDFISNKKLIFEKNISLVYFIFIDLLFDGDNQYNSCNDKMKVIVDINKKIEFLFDDFRHNLFSSLSKDEVNSNKNLRLVSKTVPYWEINCFN